MEDPERDEFEREKRASLPQVLMKCARLVNERALGRVKRRADQPRPRPAHTALFPHIAFEGTRQTELAERLGISKQAIGQLVDDLVAMGAVERVSDPSDRRAKLVRWRRRGRRWLLEGMDVLGSVGEEISDVLGPEPTNCTWRSLSSTTGWSGTRSEQRDSSRVLAAT